MPHISEPNLKTEISNAAQSILKKAALLQSQWPKEVSIDRSEDNNASIYDCFPYLFIEAFPEAPPEKVHDLSLAGRFYATSLFLCDSLMDHETKGFSSVVASVNVTALQSEANQILYDLFPPNNNFWRHFRGFLRAYVEACLKEKEFTIANRPWGEFSEELAIEIISGKDGFSRTAIAGLCELTGKDELFEPLTESIRHYYIGRQMYDDLIDWKIDLRDGSPSLVLARLLKDREPINNTNRNSPEVLELARDLYYQGHAQHVLNLALNSLHKAEDLILDIPDLSWRAAIDQARIHCQSLLSDIENIVAKNRLRVSHQPEVAVQLSKPANEWMEIGGNALRYVLNQWQTGFGEVKHVMKFPHEYGFSSNKEFHSADVFQRALIAEALCKVNDILGGGTLDGVINHETDYLVASRVDSSFGGWSYFPDLPELPPDADDLAQIMQVLFYTKRISEMDRFCAEPLEVLLSDNYHEAVGSFDTWIVPKNNRTPQQEMQAEWVSKAWGKGADPDVVANLAWALHICYGKKYSEIVQRATDYIRSVQDPDGKWVSTWYYGPYYGTHVCVRLLRAVDPSSDCLIKALNFLLDNQNPDGGWGFEEKPSDPLSTSLALLTLADLVSLDADEKTASTITAAARAADYLQNSRLEDGSYPSGLFIRMDVGRATGETWKTLIFARKTITAMYVMKAAFIWSQMSSKNAEREYLDSSSSVEKMAEV